LLISHRPWGPTPINPTILWANLHPRVPYRTALAQGATHILVLRSRRDPRPAPDGRGPARSARLIARTALRRETLALRTAFLTRDARLARDDQVLAQYQSGSEPPWVFSIRPPSGSPEVSRLATDGPLLHAAFEAGLSATHSAFHGELSPRP
jgi:hypothetical protein